MWVFKIGTLENYGLKLFSPETTLNEQAEMAPFCSKNSNFHIKLQPARKTMSMTFVFPLTQ